MSTPRNLEGFLQQREEVSFSNEPVNLGTAGTEGGGEWEELGAGVHGFTHGGVEWLLTGVDVGVICGGKISGGARFCTENVDACAVKTHVGIIAELKLNLLYLKSSASKSRRKTASSAWEIPSDIFGGGWMR
jgi:hypothetical protein